jgi:HAD superfamily hydrolase (TIGR01509 family)
MKAVGFDLDGTLIDSTGAIVASFLHTFRALGRPLPPRDAIVSTISVPLEDQFRLPDDLDVTQAAAIYREHYVREAPAATVPLPGVREALADLSAAGVRIGMATSKKRSSTEVLPEHLDLMRHFDCCIGPEDVVRAKADPEPIHALLRCLGAGPGDLVYVGDSRLDIAAAHAAGVRCWAVSTGYDTREELAGAGPEKIFDSMADVAKSVLTARRSAS